MKTLILFSFLILTSQYASFSQSPMELADLKVMDYGELETYLAAQDEKILIVNFWATWCVPCVEELPYFEQATTDFADSDLKVILVSLDFKKSVEKQLIPFINKNKLQSEVVLLSDPKMNNWINKVSSDWSGAIPATLYLSSDSKKFKEGKYASYDELNKSISTFQKLTQ